jgi:hypothetical protein
MYFWRIEKLKQEMANRPLTDREALPYFLVYSGLTAAAGYVAMPLENAWDWAQAAWAVLIAILGAIHLYRSNGGNHGEYFFQRYFALGWVVGLRWLLVAVLVLVAFHVPMAFFRPDVEDTQWYDLLLLVVLETGLYWRIGHHIKDLARRVASVTPPVLA